MEGPTTEATLNRDDLGVSSASGSTEDPPVLCKDTLAQVWSDMKRTVLPSTISPVPREVGSPRAGKLTADQWRTFCTIHLVVTLTRLWGSAPPEGRQVKMLDNFLHLVTFTNLLHMRILNSNDLALIEQENLAYLTGLRELYPRFNLVPKHHMSLHLPAMLKDFGPVHSWRTFAFERLNQIYQNIATNNLSGVEVLLFFLVCLNLTQANSNGQFCNVFA